MCIASQAATSWQLARQGVQEEANTVRLQALQSMFVTLQSETGLQSTSEIVDAFVKSHEVLDALMRKHNSRALVLRELEDEQAKMAGTLSKLRKDGLVNRERKDRALLPKKIEMEELRTRRRALAHELVGLQESLGATIDALGHCVTLFRSAKLIDEKQKAPQ